MSDSSTFHEFSRFSFNLISLLILFVVAIAGGYLPLYLINKGKREQGQERSVIFQLGCMLSGGVMLSAGLCHLLSESIYKISGRVDDHLPLGSFLCGCGFILTLLADQIAKYVISSRSITIKSKEKIENVILVPENDLDSIDIADTEMDKLNKTGCCDEVAVFSSDNHKMTFFTACFLGIALSIHSILEGLALGSQKTVSDSKDIFIAIVAHKGLAAYALGATLVDSCTSTLRFWCVITLFSLATPFGVIIGFILSEYSDNFVAACLSATAAGTFLYVALMEVLPKELADKKNIFKKLLMLLIGYGLMSALAIWA